MLEKWAGLRNLYKSGSDTKSFSLATLSNEGFKFYAIMIIVFVLFSHICPTETTTVQSFAYTSLWSWNVGVKKFDLQVLLLVLYHINWFDQLAHMTLLGDLLAWYVFRSDPRCMQLNLVRRYTIIASYNIGPYLLASVLILQLAQLYTYKDVKFTLLVTLPYLSLIVLATALVSSQIFNDTSLLIPAQDSMCILLQTLCDVLGRVARSRTHVRAHSASLVRQ